MSDLITTLHPQDDNSVNLYPNIKLENIIDGKAEDAGKFVKVNEEGKFIVETVDIPEPQQVNNSTVTIKQGGVDKGSFTLNQAEDATIELDAGSAGESGSSMYATSSAISKGVPAHIEAANPIKVGDTISQLYFNTQQDIGDYLADVVDWGNSGKVRMNVDMLSYPLLSVTPASGSVGTKIEVGSYVRGLTTGSQVNTGDKNTVLDDILKNMAIESSTGIKVLLKGLINGSNSPVDILQAHKDVDHQIVSLQRKNSNDVWENIYTTDSGYVASQQSSNDIYYFSLAELDNSDLNPKEVIITSIDPSFEPLNGDIFGAYSITGKPVLTAMGVPENPDYYRPKSIYMLISNLAEQESDLSFYYVSTDAALGDGIIPGGWKISPDFKLTLSSPEVVSKLQLCVASIASTENNWVNMPEVYGNIYKENILGTDDIKVDDVLVDTKGKFGKVKEIAEVSFKNQHAENPFTLGEEITADSALYVDPDASIDFSKFDWDNAEQMDMGPTITLMSTSSPRDLGVVFRLDPLILHIAGGILVDNPIYMLVIGGAEGGPNHDYVIYIKIDPNDAEKIIGSYFEDILIPEAFNKFAPNGKVEKVNGLYKIPLSEDVGSTIQSINDQDIWTSAISKDGKWIQDEPTIKTEIRCGALTNLPKSYNQLTDTPIIKVSSFDVERELIPASYANKYVQDSVGFIWFCDGERFYELKGSASGFNGSSINISTTNGIRTLSTSSSSTNYNTTIGLEPASLGDYSQADGDQVFGKRSSNYGWIRLPSQSGAQIQAGSGIEVSGNTVSLTSTTGSGVIDNIGSVGKYVLSKDTASGSIEWSSISIPTLRKVDAGTGISIERASTSDTINLSQDVQDKLAKIPDTAIETYSEGTGIALTQTSGNDKQISLSQDYITKLKPIIDAQDDLITDLVHKTTDNETAILAKYTKPETGIPASDLASDVQDSLTKANSALQESALSGYATTSQVDAKYTKPAAGIPETDLSADVQSALTKANSAITSLPTNTVTTDTEQTLTGKKAFNGGLSSSTTGSNGIQTTVDFGAGSNVKVEQEKSGAKVGIQYNVSENQLSIYNITGSKESRLDFNGDGVKYGASELATKADLNAKIANSNFIASADYDNTTLKAHIDEILGYVNSENGGTLVSVGFKVGATGASTTITNLHMSSDNTISIDTETDVILGAGSYYYAYPEQVVTSGANEGVFFTCRNGFTLGHGILYITDAGTKEAKLTGESTVITSATQITKMMFQDVDISGVNLEHLTINFYKFNQAE